MEDILEKKKYWVTWEDKVKDLVPCLDKIYAKLDGDNPDPSLIEQKDALKAIHHELHHDSEEARKKAKVPRDAYLSAIAKIYKMPGCFNELYDLLESHTSLNDFEKELIIEEWKKQYNHGNRVLVNKSPTPQEDIIKMEELLTRKCAEIDKPRAKMMQLSDQYQEALDLLLMVNKILSKIKFSEHKSRSSSSRKDKKRQENISVEDNVTSPTQTEKG